MKINLSARQPKHGDTVRVVMEGRVTSVNRQGEMLSFTINGVRNPVNAWASHVKSVEYITPDEPLGLGAVVVDAEGRTWVRILSHGKGCTDWVQGEALLQMKLARYTDIGAVEILAHGTTRTP